MNIPLNDLQYEVVKAVLMRGCPALADDLLMGINGLIQENTELKKQLEKENK
jgi:hypothetical protein